MRHYDHSLGPLYTSSRARIVYCGEKHCLRYFLGNEIETEVERYDSVAYNSTPGINLGQDGGLLLDVYHGVRGRVGKNTAAMRTVTSHPVELIWIRREGNQRKRRGLDCAVGLDGFKGT